MSKCEGCNGCFGGCVIEAKQPRTVSVVHSSKHRWYAPRVHVVIRGDTGHIEDYYQDCTVWHALAFIHYFERLGYEYQR